MARDSRRLLSRLTLACPFCLDASDSLLAEGARAGALALSLVAAGVIAGLARFIWRIVKAERGS